MPKAEPARPARDEPGSDLLGLLADALPGRVEKLISERVDGPARSAALEPADGRWLRVSEVAERVGACERTVYRALHDVHDPGPSAPESAVCRRSAHNR